MKWCMVIVNNDFVLNCFVIHSEVPLLPCLGIVPEITVDKLNIKGTA